MRFFYFFQTVKSNKKYMPICASCTNAKKWSFVTIPKNVDNFLKGKEKPNETEQELVNAVQKTDFGSYIAVEPDKMENIINIKKMMEQ